MRNLPIALLATVLLAACGGGAGATTPAGATTSAGQATQAPAGATTLPQGPGGGATVDACKYLTDADIKAVTNLETKPPVKGPQFGIFASACGWDLVATDVMVPPTIALGIIPSGGKSNYDNYFGPFYDDLGFEPLEGLGDKAADAGGGAVLVLAGDTLFQLQYLALRDTDTEVATELARKVIANLGK
jgi:hypothetical protein